MPDPYANGAEDYADFLAARPKIDRLIIAARVVCYGDRSDEDIKALDIALESFADYLPWDDEDEGDPRTPEYGVAP